MCFNGFLGVILRMYKEKKMPDMEFVGWNSIS